MPNDSAENLDARRGTAGIGHNLHRYAIALMAVAAAVVARIALQPALSTTVPYMTFWPAVVFAAWRGGFGPGVLSGIASTGAAWLLVPHAGDLRVELLGAILFAGVSVAISWMNEGRLRAQDAAEVALREATSSLRERDAAARALEESSRLNQEILGSISDGVVGIDREWRYVYVNDRATQIFRKPRESMLGRTVWEVFPQAEGSVSQARMRRTMSDRTVEHWEEHFEPLRVWIEATSYPAPNGITAYIRDVTPQRAAAKALAQSEERYRALFETTLDGIAIVDDGGGYSVVNESYGRMLGTSRAALRAASFFDAVPGGGGRAREAFERLQKAGSLSAQFAVTRADGQKVEVEWRARAAIVPGLHLWVGRDVTEREKLLSQIQHERFTLALLLQQLPSAVIVADRNGKLIMSNDRVRQIWRHEFISARSVEEYNAYRGFHADGRPYEAHEWPLARALAGETVRNLEIEIQRGDGSRGYILNSAVPLGGSGGPIDGAVVVFDDITDRKRLDEQLRQTAKLESLGVLAGGIAHDFNNLLVGILGNASLLEDEIATAAGRDRLAEVSRASQRLADLTRQLLAYAGKGRIELRRVDVSDLVRDIAELIRASIPKSAHVRLELKEDLPGVMGDAGQLEQVVMNLVINAAEAIPPGRDGVVLVTTGVQEVDEAYAATRFGPEVKPGRYCVIEVHDNGIGMDAATQSRIFDPFFTTKFTGRGLGLAAVLGIIHSHGGGLRVYSTPGEGSTFKVLLPATDAPPDAGKEPRAEDVRGSGEVLVVDDEQIVLTVARHALERQGYTVSTADGGRRAVEIYRERRGKIAAVVLDLTMPDMNGEETMRALQAVDPGVRVLLSSGYSEAEAIRHFTGKGLAGFIQKPYTAKALAQAVRRAVEDGRQR